jgi:hypothetical protein
VNDSSTGGYLAPDPATAPIDDAAFDAFMQQVVVGITGLPGTLVFPRWQPEPPDLPAFGTNWCAIGEVNVYPDIYAAVIHDPVANNGNGTDYLQRQETIELIASFYGPNCRSFCGMLRDGLQIAQNREVMSAAGMNLVETGNPRRAPVLIKNLWTDRIDQPFTIRRAILRSYPVLSLLSEAGTLVIDTGGYKTSVNVPHP